MSRGWRGTSLLAVAVLAATSLVAACGEDEGGDEGPLRIGYLADFSGPLAEFGPEIQTGVELAVKHINDAGGVNGSPIEIFVGDDQTDQTAATEEARRLIDVEGVTAIVGPLGSGVSIAVAESVAAPAEVVVISPSATSPGLTNARDEGFLFRSTTSDAAQGVVLADLAREEGIESVGVLYLNDAYGEGLARAFESDFGAENATLVPFDDGQSTYLAELQRAAEGGADVLVAIGYPAQAQIFIREALENEIFNRFLFVDGTKSQDLIDAVGADALDGMKGTAPTGGPETDAVAAWNAAYEAEHGALPTRPYVREAYDAVVAIALAAERAGSNAGSAIRDELVTIASPPGDTYIPGADGVRAALEAVRNGDDINFEGAATSLNWDDAGDVLTGYVGIWQYDGGEIVELEAVAFDLSQ